jgi:hypothetical protein
MFSKYDELLLKLFKKITLFSTAQATRVFPNLPAGHRNFSISAPIPSGPQPPFHFIAAMDSRPRRTNINATTHFKAGRDRIHISIYLFRIDQALNSANDETRSHSVL